MSDIENMKANQIGINCADQVILAVHMSHPIDASKFLDLQINEHGVKERIDAYQAFINRLIGHIEQREFQIKNASQAFAEMEQKFKRYIDEVSEGTVTFAKVGIEKLGFTVRTLNCLKAENIYTVGCLTERTRVDLMKIPGLGSTCLREIEEKLKKLGLELANRSKKGIA